jgi:hypothetical protein
MVAFNTFRRTILRPKSRVQLSVGILRRETCTGPTAVFDADLRRSLTFRSQTKHVGGTLRCLGGNETLGMEEF